MKVYEVLHPDGRKSFWVIGPDGKTFDVYPSRAKMRKLLTNSQGYMLEGVKFTKMTMEEFRASKIYC